MSANGALLADTGDLLFTRKSWKLVFLDPSDQRPFKNLTAGIYFHIYWESNGLGAVIDIFWKKFHGFVHFGTK